MSSIPSHFFSVFFVLGALVVATYAWQRFNEPSFPNQQTLPRTVDPLRYLFLRSSYWRARFTYVAVTFLLYCVFVWPGPSIVPVFGIAGAKDFPAEAWALLVALFLVGVVPNSNMKWLTFVEEMLRRWVHAWFLVPDGVMRTIGVLEDARYEPPQRQLDDVPNPLREQIRDGLKSPTNSLGYRWARAQMLMASLKQMGAGNAHPLKQAAFEPFRDDHETIRKNYRSLESDIGLYGEQERTLDADENLVRSVDNLLKQIYAYIAWGIRHQADSDREVDQTLEELGFRIPKVAGRRLFDIVAPAILLIAGITLIFWIAVDSVLTRELPMSQIVVYATSSAIAASVMYGSAVLIALSGRETQIEQKIWRGGSPKCLVPIALRAGLVSWGVIVITTVVWQIPSTWQSLTGLAQMVRSLAGGDGTGIPPSEQWRLLPMNIAMAASWLFAGATVGVMLACAVGGDVRRTGLRERLRDAGIFAFGLGMAAGAAQLLQISIAEALFNERTSPLTVVPVVSLAGAACGAIIGYMVPDACRTNVVSPHNPEMAQTLRALLRRAEFIFGDRHRAEDWVFSPIRELGDITPAEASQYQGHATGVWQLLENETHGPHAPTVITGGRERSVA